MSPPGGRHFLANTWLNPTTCRLQCWHASGQTTNSEGTQPHPSADRLPKVFLSSQLPLNIPLDTTLLARGITHSSTHQWSGNISSHQGAGTGHIDQPHSPGTELKSIKLKMKMEKLQWTPQKYKGS